MCDNPSYYTKINGHEKFSYPLKSLGDCLGYCLLSSDCVGWTFNMDNNDCSLYSIIISMDQDYYKYSSFTSGQCTGKLNRNFLFFQYSLY